MKKWNDMDEKDRVCFLLEKVMGYLEETAQGFSTPEFAKGKQAPAGFHWPIAFWNTDGEGWAYCDVGDNNITFFDPLHDLNDAWKIAEKLHSTGRVDIQIHWNMSEQEPRLNVVFQPAISCRLRYNMSGPTLTGLICAAAHLFVEAEQGKLS